MKQPIPFGKYLLLERINVGGMAEIFLARSRGVHGFKRILAIKKILPTMAEDKEFIAMFIDEARIAAELSHAGIVQIFELGKYEDDYYIAMEFIHGKDLRFIQERMTRERIPMPVSKAAFITYKICEALDYAHTRKDSSGRPLGIVHRDVSPQNVLISYEGEVKICDFGIAKAANRSQKTQAGVLKGKFGYMSPEQVRGLPLDGRSDIFTVGTLLYEMVTLERLFVGESDFSTLEKVRNADVVPPSAYNREVPEELEDIILRALAKEVEDRFQNTAEFGDALQAFLLKSGMVSARDLSSFMRKVFSAELEAELRRLEQYQDFSESSLQLEEQTGDDDFASELSSETSDEDADLDAKTLIFASHEVEGNGRVRSTPPPVPSENQAPWQNADASGTNGLEIAEAKTMIFSDAQATPVATSNPDLAAEKTMLFSDPEIQPDEDIHELPTRGVIDRPDLRLVEPESPKPASARGRSIQEKLFFPLAVIMALLLGWSAFVSVRLAQQENVPSETGFELITHPATGVEVMLDGRHAATLTPFVGQDLAPGVHSVKVTRMGYQPFERKVTIKAGTMLVLDATLARSSTALKDKNIFKKTTVVKPGTRTDPLRQEKPDAGIGNRQQTTKKIAEKLPKNPVVKTAELRVVTKPSGAQISVNGKKLGHAPIASKDFKVGAKLKIAAMLRGYRSARREVEIKNGNSNEIKIEMEKIIKPKEPKKPRKPLFGFLVANTRPWSKVFIDGKYSGRETPIAPDKKLKLTAGKHKVIFETPGGKRYVFEVVIEPGKILKLIKRLEE